MSGNQRAESLNQSYPGFQPYLLLVSLAGFNIRLPDAGRQPAGVKLGTIPGVGTPGWGDSGRWSVVLKPNLS